MLDKTRANSVKCIIHVHPLCIVYEGWQISQRCKVMPCLNLLQQTQLF